MDRRALRRGGMVAVALAAPPFVIFVHPTVALLHRNGDYFAAGHVAGWQLYLAAAGLLLVGAVLWFLRSSAGVRVVLSVYLLSGVGWFAYGLARQAMEARGLLLAAFGVAVVIGGVRLRDRAEEAIPTLALAGAVLVAGLASSVWLDPSALWAPAVASDRVGASDDAHDAFGRAAGERSELPNIYHVVLDEFQTEMFEATRTDAWETRLDGFHYFPDASTPFGRTEAAMASMFAPRSYAYDEPLAEYIERAYTDDESLLGILRRAGYETTAWAPSFRIFGGTHPFDVAHRHRDVDGVFATYGEEASLARSTWVYSQLPRTISSRVIPRHHFDQLVGGVLLPDDAPPVSAMSFRTFLREEADAPSHGRYVFVHLLLPHFPYVLDADCGYRPGTRTRVDDQVGCASRLIEDFLGRLRSLDRYDGSLIVIQGDHGSGYELEDGALQPVPHDLYSERWSRSRSRPLLLFKAPGSRHEGLRVSRFAATLEDVGATIADVLDLGWESADGRTSLLAADLPDRRRRYYHFYDKHADPSAVIDGELHRYVITPDGIEYERAIRVPSR